MKKCAQTDEENKDAQNYGRAISVPHVDQVWCNFVSMRHREIRIMDLPATAVSNWRRYPSSILMAASLARCQSDCAQEYHPARGALEMVKGLLLEASAPRCKILAGHHDNVLTQSLHDNMELHTVHVRACSLSISINPIWANILLFFWSTGLSTHVYYHFAIQRVQSDTVLIARTYKHLIHVRSLQHPGPADLTNLMSNYVMWMFLGPVLLVAWYIQVQV